MIFYAKVKGGGGGLANFTPIARMGHLISEPKFKIPSPLPPANFWQVPESGQLLFSRSKRQSGVQGYFCITASQ